MILPNRQAHVNSMNTLKTKSSIHPVGIDLGTTYSCISYLTAQGQPVTLPNSEGELATPSVVLFDGAEVVVGTEAQRNAVSAPERVVTQAKRYIGDPNKCWVFDGHVYRPADISAFILRKLLDGAEERLGRIRHAVITVPAQFSDVQRQQTVEAGIQAGLERIDIINEPVAAALCYVLSEGSWFAEIANDQMVMVFDLGGGTFDLSLVKYNKSEVRVIASGGDLRLGGLDWNKALEDFACDEFSKLSASDPRLDRESMQALSNEVEQVKRSLSVRPKASLVVQHEGKRKTFLIDRERFELLTSDLVKRTEDITKAMLKTRKLGWAHVDSVLVTGGASRMPMIRDMLSRISGTTLNTTLSPDQSICHGAAYYAGMLLSGQRLEKTSLNKEATAKLSKIKQQSVSGRALGILIRDMESGERRPHYLIPANTPLPCAFRQKFGTVIPNQKKVHLYIVESGTSTQGEHVELGECLIEDLPNESKVGSPIEVTIRYDEQGLVHVEAVDVASGKSAKTSIVRRPTAAEKPPQPAPPVLDEIESSAVSIVDDPSISTETPVIVTAEASPSTKRKQPVIPDLNKQPVKKSKRPVPTSQAGPVLRKTVSLEEAERPIPLCNKCGEVLGDRAACSACGTKAGDRRQSGQSQKRKTSKSSQPITEPISGVVHVSPKKRPQLRKDTQE